jgi:hypothetical protein
MTEVLRRWVVTALWNWSSLPFQAWNSAKYYLKIQFLHHTEDTTSGVMLQLMANVDIIADYSENHTKSTNIHFLGKTKSH